MNIYASVSEAIFVGQPTFVRGLILAVGMDNAGGDPALQVLLDGAVVDAADRPVDLAAHPAIRAWELAHKQFGSNPNRWPPSHVALRKRVQKRGVSLPFVNKAVAIMNYCSIADTIPVGGDDLAHAGNRLELRLAIGDEEFIPLGCPEALEHPAPGEVVYAAGDSVLCRRWNWRNSHPSRIREKTRLMVMNVDGLGEESEERVLLTTARVAHLLRRFCHAKVTTALLSAASPEHRFDCGPQIMDVVPLSQPSPFPKEL